MVTNQLVIIAATLIVSLFSLSGILALHVKEETLHRILFFLVAFSAGSILGASIFDLLPEAVELVDESVVFIYVAFGFVAFFFLDHGDIEKERGERASTREFAYLNVIGDGIHNFIDGMIIATSFLVGIHVGLATTLAVIFHELPQEMGDYGILVYAGFKRGMALALNFLAALMVVVGGVFASFFIETVDALSGLLIAFSAGAFIYLAASELVPELKEEGDFWMSLVQFSVFILGLALIWYLGIVFHE